MRISIKIKLISAFLLIALLVVGLSYFSVRAVQQIHVGFSDIVNNHVPRLTVLEEMRFLSQRLDKETSIYESNLKIGDNEEQKKNLLADLDRLGDKEVEYLGLIAAIDEPNEKTKVASTFDPVAEAKSQAVGLVAELIALKEENAASSVIQAKVVELAEIEEKLEQHISTAVEQDLQDIELNSQVTSRRVDQVERLAMVGSLGASLIAVLLGLVLSLSVARNVDKLKIGSARLASGDFSNKIAVTSHDELGELAASFNKMSDSLRSSYLRLALEKERDETLLESMSEGMVALDQAGKIVLINTVAASMLGLTSKPTGVSFSAMVPLLLQDGKPPTPDALPTSILQTGQIVNSVFAFQSKAGKILLNVAASPVKLDEQIAGAVLILRDVTKEKEVDRMKTEFISLASHQLRTPLSAIKWFGEMLLNGDAGELQSEQKDFAKNIADATDRMVDLVNSLLNISRIESGRIIVDPKPTDLKELITGIVNDLKAKTEERQQTLVISVHSDLPKINLDPRLIGQVYMNLLTNAIKYTPKQGEISVVVSKKGNDVISQVTDNGYGIPKDQQGRIFQKFFRAENVAKVETDGTGLGLYLIKAIVESSGGKIWFASEEGKGTTFWFTLPLSGMKPKEGEVTLDG